jgi:molybdenum cofactor cytidylyltransferase
MANNVGILILAAGSSSRLGQPKQLLKYKDTSLLRHTVETALATRCGGPVLVVTGALHDELFKECKDLNMSVVHNVNWQMGMATSIHTGLRALSKAQPDTTGALILLCDQPLITIAHLDNLLDMFEHRRHQGIVATAFANTTGAPAIFSRELFAALYELKGDKGARQVFNEYDSQLVTVPFKPAAVDVDTMEDYEGLTP